MGWMATGSYEQTGYSTFVRVDEKGTEAAAATGIGVGATAAPVNPPIPFTADHPFLFLIRERKSNALLFAGRVVARPDTRIGLPELGLGLVPGAGGTVSLTRRIGRHRTAYLALSGDVIDARTALDWGLLDAVIEETP